jgi:hypothetical protein
MTELLKGYAGEERDGPMACPVARSFDNHARWNCGEKGGSVDNERSAVFFRETKDF